MAGSPVSPSNPFPPRMFERSAFSRASRVLLSFAKLTGRGASRHCFECARGAVTQLFTLFSRTAFDECLLRHLKPAASDCQLYALRLHIRAREARQMRRSDRSPYMPYRGPDRHPNGPFEGQTTSPSGMASASSAGRRTSSSNQLSGDRGPQRPACGDGILRKSRGVGGTIIPDALGIASSRSRPNTGRRLPSRWLIPSEDR